MQRWQLLARLLLALVVGGWFWRSGSPGLGLLLGALVFWSYGLVMLGAFMSLLRTNRGEVGVPKLLLACWRELLVCEWVFAWQQPFNEHRVADFLPAQTAQRGVLLLHGYTCNRGLWNDWMPRLRRAGHPHIALSMEPAFGSIDAYADQIESAVQRLTDATGQAPLIVAHSMGGLAARAWWRRFGASGSVLRIVTLGTPHAGTVMARFSPAFNARQMRRRSPWLAELAMHESSALGAEFDCYYSESDHIVCPMGTAVLPGSRAIHIAGTGHLALVFNARVFSDVLSLLRPPP